MPKRTPRVRKNQEASVQRRVARIHSSSRRFVAMAAMAKAKGMVNPTYPRYCVGGGEENPRVWRRGGQPCPSGGAKARRAKGLLTTASSSVKKTETPITVAMIYGINSR